MVRSYSNLQKLIWNNDSKLTNSANKKCGNEKDYYEKSVEKCQQLCKNIEKDSETRGKKQGQILSKSKAHPRSSSKNRSEE
ncbi:unnamed protein product [Caenorhabditis angaria]|uniref:Uncharacterized protein n=1 Tax=Caenorhabditis angaria TaxID=860376 RepID=A0A9P1J016_9PELO|nr:unnamed protein product [Caenorhabditis angaria]